MTVKGEKVRLVFCGGDGKKAALRLLAKKLLEKERRKQCAVRSTSG